MGLGVGYPPSLEELYRQMSSSPAFAQMMMRQDQKEPGGASWLQARQRVHGLNIPPMPQMAAPPQQMPSQALSALGAPPGPPPQMPPQAPMPMGLPPMPQAQNQPSRGLRSGLIPEGGEFKERLGDMLLGMGGGSNINESLALGGRAMMEGRRARAPLRAATEKENRTRAYAIQLGIPEDVAMGLDATNLMALIREKYEAQNKTPDPMDALKLKREQLEIGNLENPKPDKPDIVTLVSPDGKQRRSINVATPQAESIVEGYLQRGWVQAGGSGGAPDEYGLQPIVTQDETGKYHLFQANKGGGPPKEIPLPYGWTPHQQYLDTGTGFQAVPRQGVGSGAAIPKDIAGEAAAKAAGAAKGVAGAELPAAVVDATRTIQKIDELLADPDLSGATGWQGYLPDRSLPFVPGAGQGAYAARTKINQLHGRAFMDAYATLKGGGVITEIEGEKATVALARLNDPGISDDDYKTALQDFRDAVQTGLQKIAARAGQSAPDITSESGGGKPADWTDEEWNALTPEERAGFGRQ